MHYLGWGNGKKNAGIWCERLGICILGCYAQGARASWLSRFHTHILAYRVYGVVVVVVR